ncbi:MAG: hypothetical protein R3F35_06960 [Myxococcota bacterium]
MNSTRPPAWPTRSAPVPDRLRWIAAATLAAVMAAHVLLETACDALFLANVSVDRLPWVTIAVAGLAVVAARGRTDDGHRAALLVIQLAAAAGTLGFAILVGETNRWTYYALPMWAGIVTSLIVVRFWLVLGDLFTIIEGKRLFASIAMGGSLGALFGSAIAATLAPMTGGRGLLFAAALAYAVSSLGPLLALGPDRRAGRARPRLDATGAPPSLRTSLDALVSDPYASRIALLVMLGSMTLTLGDFLFKSVLTAEVASIDLATWLARIYLGLNLLSVGMLAIGVTPIVRGLGVDRSLSVLPVTIALAAIGTLAGGALAPVVFLKVCDGTLRYSLHKTASELLYLPMSSALRSAIKGAVDILGQTLAKALASFLLLGLVLLPAPRSAVAVAVLVAALLWTLSSLLLRRSYLEVFRRTLREGTLETAIEHPELDLDSIGSLIRALSDPDERHVIAAMRILSERGHADLIPSLILYHPSPRVVTHALDVFAAAEREDLDLFLDRMIEHEEAMVRAAAVRATWMIRPDRERLDRMRESHCAVVRVSATAGLFSLGAIDAREYAHSLEEALAYPTYEPRLAASIAARLRYHPVNREALLRMTGDPDPEVAEEAVRAIAASGDDWFTRPLVDRLADRRIRDGVRRALIARGEAALEVLAHALVSPDTPADVTRHIPRTIARFDSPAAARVLVESLPLVENGMVRFKLLRGLETWLRERRRIHGLRGAALASLLDQRGIRVEFARTLARCLELFEVERLFVATQHERRRLSTVGGELVVELLRDKRTLATGRLVVLLGLMHPDEDFRAIAAALAGDDAQERAHAQELIETVLSREHAEQVLRLLAEERRRGPGVLPDRAPEALERAYEDVVKSLLRDDSLSVRAVAMYHAGEMGFSIDDVLEQEGMDGEARDAARGVADLRERGLAVLRGTRSRGRRRLEAIGAN